MNHLLHGFNIQNYLRRKVRIFWLQLLMIRSKRGMMSNSYRLDYIV